MGVEALGIHDCVPRQRQAFSLYFQHIRFSYDADVGVVIVEEGFEVLKFSLRLESPHVQCEDSDCAGGLPACFAPQALVFYIPRGYA